MIGHVGNKASALIDGQLPQAEAERLWSHVHVCPLCRAEVEREGWVKTQLAGLAMLRPAAPAERLRAGLAEVRYGDVALPEATQGSGPERRRMMTLAIAGAGTFGVAMVGVIAMSVPAENPGVDRRNPATSLTRPSEPAGSSRSSSQNQARLPVRVAYQQWEKMIP